MRINGGVGVMDVAREEVRKLLKKKSYKATLYNFHLKFMINNMSRNTK